MSVRPALSAEEWERRDRFNYNADFDSCYGRDEEDRLQIAAINLDGHPQGFRWEDVERCRARARRCTERAEDFIAQAQRYRDSRRADDPLYRGEVPQWERRAHAAEENATDDAAEAAEWASLADRIEALLRPRKDAQ